MKAQAIAILLFIILCSPGFGFGEDSHADKPREKQAALKLSAADPGAGKLRAAKAKIIIPRGAGPELWLSVSGAAPVSELSCRDNKLQNCPALHFLVSGPGLENAVKVFFKGSPNDLDNRKKPKTDKQTDQKTDLKLQPLTPPSAGKFVLLNRGESIFDIFNRGGEYTVQAVAGDLRSNALPVFVDKSLPPVADAIPEKKRENLVKIPVGAVWKPGDQIIARQDANGRLTWKTKLREPISTLVQEGDEWIATSNTGKQYGIDIATGRMLWAK